MTQPDQKKTSLDTSALMAEKSVDELILAIHLSTWEGEMGTEQLMMQIETETDEVWVPVNQVWAQIERKSEGMEYRELLKLLVALKIDMPRKVDMHCKDEIKSLADRIERRMKEQESQRRGVSALQNTTRAQVADVDLFA